MNGQQLKNSILQMAVQGKLVPQDPNDEPASVLIQRIREEKEKLIKEKKIKKEKNPSYIFRGSDNLHYEKIGANDPICIDEKIPFEIPESWELCRLGDLYTTVSGLAYKKDDLQKKSDCMVTVLRGGNIEDEKYFFRPDDVTISSEFVKNDLFLKKGYMITPAVSSLEHIGKIALIDQDYSNVVVGGFVLMLQPFFNDEVISKYLLYAFAAKHHRDNCRSITHKSGQAFYNLSREKLLNLPIPIPPLNEMERIVKKLEELLPHIDEYDDKASMLIELKDSFPNQLKKSILQEAVQGKLVPQDPSDEPASILLERIREEKARLIKDGKIKKDKNESVIFRRDNSYYEKVGDNEPVLISDKFPFDIPDSWELCRLGDFYTTVSGLAYKKGDLQKKSDLMITVLRGGNIGDEKYYFKPDDVTISSEFVKRDLFLKKGYMITPAVSSIDHIGKIALIDRDYPNVVVGGFVLMLQPFFNDEVISKYFLYAFAAKHHRENCRSITHKSGQAFYNLSREKLLNLPVPVPPLMEMKRIVDKIEELLGVIKAL